MPRRIYPNLHAFLANQDEGTMSDLATELGCSVAYLSQIKWGTRQPELGLALRIAQRCNIPLESLIRNPRRKAS